MIEGPIIFNKSEYLEKEIKMSTEETGKVVDFKDGRVLVKFAREFDTNKDGEPVLGLDISLWVDITELPDEAIDAWKSRKEKP